MQQKAKGPSAAHVAIEVIRLCVGESGQQEQRGLQG